MGHKIELIIKPKTVYDASETIKKLNVLKLKLLHTCRTSELDDKHQMRAVADTFEKISDEVMKKIKR